ncbi:MAG: sigma-70 family RNA polymerase sigma factor [Bacteroidota bacterium]|nr:sigma-70 family RNA polymerase sigma factor [Bacteroidota bacterium]
MKKITLMLLSTFFLIAAFRNQEIIVTGKVTDENGNAITANVKAGKAASIADANGNYKIKIAEDAKDSVINIFEELVGKLKKYQVDNFKGWLYQLTKNYCLMKLRSDKKYPVNIDVDIVHLAENNHLDNVMEKEQDLNTMEYCIEQLPGEQKTAIQLFYIQEKCYKEIADNTDTDINKVRSFIQNGRRNLKICMEKQALQKA